MHMREIETEAPAAAGPAAAALRMGLAGMLVCWAAAGASAAEWTVSKDGRGQFSTVQAAVDRARPYDIVTILDAAVYEEQVTIRPPLHHFTLRSAAPLSPRKPVIRWLDRENAGPKTCQEALDPAKLTFERNGALRLLGVRDARLEGIAVSGGGQTPFAYANVWGDGKTCNGMLLPLFHGNGALVMHSCFRGLIRNCTFADAYFGIYLKDPVAAAPFAPRAAAGASPLADMAVGNHLFEGNSIHDNAWGVFVENAWGLGSTFRDNHLYRNHHADGNAVLVKAMPDGGNQPGGAFLFKDAMVAPFAIHNNTFSDNLLLIAGHYRPGAQHLLANNIFAAPHAYWGGRDAVFTNSFQELTPFFLHRAWHTAFAAQTEPPVIDSQKVTAQLFDAPANRTVAFDSIVRFYRSARIMVNMDLVEKTDFIVNMRLDLSDGPHVVSTTVSGAVVPGNLIRGTAGLDIPRANNLRWLETKFESKDSSSPGFFRPTDASGEILREGWPALEYKTAAGAPAPIGALAPPERPAGILRLTPLAPVHVEENRMVLAFSLEALPDSGFHPGSAPQAALFQLAAGIPINPNGFGGNLGLALKEPRELPQPDVALRYGYNEIGVPLGGQNPDSLAFGFVEMAVRDGSALSNVAGFPVVPLSNAFEVIVSAAGGDTVSEIATGQILTVRVSYRTPPAGANPIKLFAASGAPLSLSDSSELDSAGFFRAAPPFTTRLRLNEVPEGGVELVCASSMAGIDSRTGGIVGYGRSRAIRVKPSGVPVRQEARLPRAGARKPLRDLLGRKAPRGAAAAGPRIRG